MALAIGEPHVSRHTPLAIGEPYVSRHTQFLLQAFKENSLTGAGKCINAVLALES